MRLILLVALALGPSMPTRAPASGAEQVAAQVTVYDATWCSACKSLEAALRSRGIPFDTVDVEANPGAYSIAKKATGTNAIPLTNIIRGPMQSWVVGANADAVEKAYRGD